MIVNNNISPERDLYYLGAKLIEIMMNQEEVEVDYFELYQKVNLSLNISISLYTLVLDWLFIIGLINNPQNGTITKCF
jgi:hypothetical protein